MDLSTKGLQRLGLKHVDLIDTPVSAYPLTRDWAAWFHRVSPRAQGLRWTSRKDDGAQSIMLFGYQARGNALTVVKSAEPVIDEWQDVLLDLALHIGINKVVTSIR